MRLASPNGPAAGERVNNPNPFLNVAVPLALEAGEIIMTLRKEPLERSRKADHSIVTNADHAADALIRETLRKAFPTHSILTEESGLEGNSSEWVWVVDPLDGTRAYAKGVTGFSVMIGLLRDGVPHIGVVYDPLEDRLYEASKADGSYHTYKGRRERVYVSRRNAWNEMPVITSTGFPEKFKHQMEPTLTAPWLTPVNSVGVKVGIVVRQEADIYINHHPVHYWDTCAPQIILEEAGGTFTHTDGSVMTYNLTKEHVHPFPSLATNGFRHAEVVELVTEIIR